MKLRVGIDHTDAVIIFDDRGNHVDHITPVQARTLSRVLLHCAETVEHRATDPNWRANFYADSNS